ncbi:DUF1365 domain-containing protein [Actinomarinicola tropica]|uniref:DUF1365 domain-containing protein n=1 Tax=Actinomarinicola tropica TaxID=2789776 RepID=UPI00189C4848|nr:DUF1365 domain-containing protein [Actinomarinicola tropica]
MTIQIYDSTVRHHRGRPDHRFAVRARYVVAEASDVVGSRRVPGWPGARLRRRDVFDGTDAPLDAAVRDLVDERLGRRPSGPVLVMTQPRSLGWLFNPLTVMWCLSDDGSSLDAVVLEVSNTPWHERHWYVLGGDRVQRGGDTFAKEMHVSPFMPMDLAYRCRTTVPDERLSLHLQLVTTASGERVFDAGVVGRRLDAPSSWRDRVRSALQTLRVSAGIYAHAVALRRKGATFHRHPGRAAPEVALTSRRSA